MLVDWVKKKVTWIKEKWETVVFSDKKKFNLDGFDGSQCYWHDLRKEKQLFSKVPFEGESVMVWGAFSVSRKADLVVMEVKQNSARYINVLEKSFFSPFMNRLDTNNAIFQQGNAAIHTSKLTKDWFKTKNIEVLDWPTKSLDLNPIENLLGILSRRVYPPSKNVNLKIEKLKNLALNSIGMKFYLNLSENLLIQCKTGVLKY